MNTISSWSEQITWQSMSCAPLVDGTKFLVYRPYGNPSDSRSVLPEVHVMAWDGALQCWQTKTGVVMSIRRHRPDEMVDTYWAKLPKGHG